MTLQEFNEEWDRHVRKTIEQGVPLKGEDILEQGILNWSIYHSKDVSIFKKVCAFVEKTTQDRKQAIRRMESWKN